MFLIQVISIMGLIVLGNASLHASSQWVRVNEGERRCTNTCGRMGLDDVTTKIDSLLGSSICAGARTTPDPKLPGLQKLSAHPECQTGSAADNAATHCLCAEDGVAGGKDLQWLPALAKGRCDSTCKAQGPKAYGYAVYASFDEQNGWRHVCSVADGSVGFTGGGKLGCTTQTGNHSDFDCLCTRSFSGDLEPAVNP